MASVLATVGAQGPMVYEDLAVYFSQEECVGPLPAQRVLDRGAAAERAEDVIVNGEAFVFSCTFPALSVLG